jgi:protein-S-isoprenylcysteine O-methyltransferase Ste14
MKKMLPPTYFLLAIALVVLIHLLFPLCQLLVLPWRLLGLLPLTFGIVLNLLADQAFKKIKTTVKPGEPSRAMVTGGVFRVSRNPMYLGMTLALLGIVVLLGSVAPLPVVPAFALLLDRVFVVPEEESLETTFGEAFRQYRERVRRWI